MTAGAQEQRIYRSIDKNGRVTFSDVPPAQASFVETISIPTGPMSTGVPGSTTQDLPPAQQQLLNEANERARGLAEASQQISAAYADLKAATAALDAGKVSQEGDRIGTYAGRVRFTDEYWARQRQNEQAVADAQRRLDAAIASRNRWR